MRIMDDLLSSAYASESEMPTVEYHGYTIGKHPDRDGDSYLYSVWSPDGEFIFGNRSSLEKVKQDLKHYISTGGYKKWKNVRALVESDTHIPGEDIDLEIREMVRELNEMGYITLGSCSGHGRETGFVTFSNPDLSDNDKVNIKLILQDYGFTSLRFGREYNYSVVVFR